MNLITLGGWVGGILSAVLLGVSGHKGWTFADGITIGQFHLSCEMLVIIFAVCLIIVINAWLFGRLLKGAANSTADYKVVCGKLPASLQREIDVKDAASPYVNQAAAEYCSSLDEVGFKQLLNSSGKLNNHPMQDPPRRRLCWLLILSTRFAVRLVLNVDGFLPLFLTKHQE